MMNRRVRAVWLAFVFTVVSLLPIRYSNAALPLLVAEVAVTAIESFVVRSVGRQVIATVGTAANDATWAQTFWNWANAARAVGSLMFTTVDGKKYDIQVSSLASADLTKAGSSYLWKPGSGVFIIPAYQASDGVEHRSSPGQFVGTNSVALANEVLSWVNSLSKRVYTFGWSNVGDGTYEVEFSSGGYAYGVLFVGTEQEAADGVRRLKKDAGSNWTPDLTDPDWTPEEKTKFTGAAAVRFKGNASDQLDLLPSGSGSKLRYQQQVAPGTIRELAVQLNSSAIPESVASSTSPGALSSSAEDSGAGASIEFPSDYARQGEAAAAANTVKNAIDALKESPTVDDPEVPIPRLSDLQDSFYGNDNKVVGLLGWHVPGFTAQCPSADINFEWKDFNYHGRFDSHCSYAEQFRSVTAVMFDAFWLIVAFFIVLGA